MKQLIATIVCFVTMTGALLVFQNTSYAMDLYNLKAGTVHCSTPGPIESGNVYPLQQKGCATVNTVWGLLDDPVEVKPGVMKVEMGGRFGTRYVRSQDVEKQ